MSKAVEKSHDRLRSEIQLIVLKGAVADRSRICEATYTSGPEGPTGLAILVHRGHEEADVTKGRVLLLRRHNVLDVSHLWLWYPVTHAVLQFSKDFLDFSDHRD